MLNMTNKEEVVVKILGRENYRIRITDFSLFEFHVTIVSFRKNINNCSQNCTIFLQIQNLKFFISTIKKLKVMYFMLKFMIMFLILN